MRKLLVHTILECVLVSVSVMTAIGALVHYEIKRDAATPIVGIALLISGLLDGFHLLAATRILFSPKDVVDFIPFTGALTRTFHALVLAVGTGLALATGSARVTHPLRDFRTALVLGLIFLAGSYSVISLCAGIPDLPTSIFPKQVVPRPWDCVALIIYTFAGGILLPRFSQKYPSLFAHGLAVSLIPLLVGQWYVAIWSRELFDDAFIVSQFLKIIAAIVPMTGLVVDYTKAYRAESVLMATEEKLKIARQIQEGLLPKSSPPIPGFDVAGRSESPGVVGGDYFDFVLMSDGSYAIVLGDVSGHDLGASILMSQTRAYLRAEAQTQTNVASILTQLNRFLIRDVNERRFVSLFLGRLDSASRRFEFASAGQPGYVIRHSGPVETLEPSAPLLGVIDDELAAGPAVELQPGDVVIVYSDGIAESTSPSGEQFGQLRIQNTIQEHSHAPAAEIVSRVITAVRDFCWKTPPEDDLTLVIIKCGESTPIPPA